jgi:hypothetical protein
MVGAVNLITQFLDSLFSEVATAALADSPRWATVRLDSGGEVHGVVFGARLADALGVVPFLALRHDGGFRPLVVPVSGGTAVQRCLEAGVRRAFVLDVHPPYAPRGHVFRPSPVCADLCAACALDELHHRRAAVRLAVEEVFGMRDVVLDFREGSDEVDDVQVRLSTDGISHTPTRASCAARESAWLSLNDGEREAMRLRLHVYGAPLPSDALLLPCAEHGVGEFAACSHTPPHTPYRPPTDVERQRVDGALARLRAGVEGVRA